MAEHLNGVEGHIESWEGLPSKSLEMQLRVLLTVVSDTLRRARDGVPERLVHKAQLAYTAGQIAKAREHLRRCAAQIDVWTSQLPDHQG